MMFFKLFFIFIITENIYQNYIPGLNYFDEAITIIAAVFLLKEYKAHIHARKYLIKILRCILIIFLIGVCATISFRVQPDFAGIWRDAIAIIKFPICYCGVLFYMTKYNKQKIQKSILGFCKFYICLLFIFGLYNLFFYTSWLSNGIRNGLPLYSFLYTHNTFLVVSVLSILAVLLSDGIRKNKLYVVLGLVVLILTFRFKALVPVIFISGVYLFINTKRQIKHPKIKIIIGTFVMIVMAIYFSYNRIIEYISYGDESARGALYIRGLDIASDYFPLGSGFCTFASSLSAKYYSSLYYDYGLNSILGLTDDDYSYAGDVFWPNVYAQYGYIGLGLYILMLWYFYKSLSSRFRMFSNQWIGSVAIFIYSIAAAFAESFYTNDSAVIMAVMLTMYLGKDNQYIITNKT